MEATFKKMGKFFKLITSLHQSTRRNYLDRMVLKDTENSYANRKGKEQQKMFLNLLEKQQREILHLKRLLKTK